ncbi:MAG: alpha/beta hydrolase [Acidimicrobiales bacterium]
MSETAVDQAAVPSPVRWQDVTWRAPLQARVYQPDPTLTPMRRELRPLIIDVHGGAWSSRDRTLGERYNTVVAAAGFVVVAIDFRDGRQARHPAAVDDIEAAVTWARTQAPMWSADPDRVGLTGSSSGGHLALFTALTRVEVGFVGAFWPPVDPLGRYRYAGAAVGQRVPEGQQFDAVGLVRSTEQYFGDEATMGAASVAEVLGSGGGRFLPPLWVVRAGADLNVPSSMLDELVAAYLARGGIVELSDYPDQVHGFGHGGHAEARRFQADLVARLAAAFPAT